MAESLASRYQEYGEYSDADLGWLERLPAGWKTKRLKEIGALRSGAGFPHEEQGEDAEAIPFFKVSDMNLPGNSVWLRERVNTVSLATAKRLRASVFPRRSIAFPKVGAALLTNKRRLLAVPACVDNNIMVHTPREGDSRYLLYLWQQLDLRQLANPGAVPSVNEGQLRDIRVPFPTILDQRTIANFLDRETAKIDALIDRKQRLIELLQEKRTALITQAVTKGLDPSVEMKESGVEWLGKVPHAWTVMQLGHALKRITYGFTNPMPTADEGPYMITANDIGHGYVKYNTARRTSIEAFSRLLTDKSRPRGGDVLVTKDGTLGRVAVADETPACINQSVALLRAKDALVLPGFLCDLLQANTYLARMIFEAGGTTIKHIYITRLAKMAVALPSLEEQQTIIGVLKDKRERLDGVVQQVQAGLDSLAEYRTALISAAVTGKIDVREAA